ncbi:MAG: MBL fold metallo-hydrolase, partial [Desulfobacterota bacterium]|nr:MBL fold metallo-hydrolase [Thermodesulfobacteriota bacterium]
MKSKFIITFLGTGTGVPQPSRQAPGLVVRMGTTSILLDTGSGSIYQLARAGFKYYEINHLFYSHYVHPDHINDLAAIIFANQYFYPVRKTPLYIYGPPG